jgi:hypothetical protein
MKFLAHRRDPVTGDSTSFDTERVARLFFELAVTYWMSFTEVYRMAMAVLHGPEALNENFDLEKELRQGVEEGKQDTELLKNFVLPPAELFQIWMRSRRQLQRLAEFSNCSPARRQKIEAMLAKSGAEMIANLERHERHGRGQIE